MKYRIRFSGEDKIVLPIQYKHVIHAAFLNWLQNGEYTDFIHDSGYATGKRQYKLYTISDILSPGKKVGSKLIFDEEIELLVSSYMPEMDENILNTIREEVPLRLGAQELLVEEYEIIEETYEECVVRTVSPVTIHSTFELPGGNKKTYYYAVTEDMFSKMIRENIIRKHVSIYGIEPENEEFEISLINKKHCRKIIINYKSTVIIGWKADFKISGNPELIRIALLCGIGSRNSVGMGMLVQINE